jgi:hypothetical protein
MAIDIPAIYKQLQGGVNKFVQDSKAWRDKIASDGKTTDPADLEALKQLVEVEKNLTKDVQGTAPKYQVALRDVFIAVDGHLTQAKDFYSVLVGVSQTPVAKNKESLTRKSLKLLIIEMNKLRLQVVGPASVNLFLSEMESLVGKGPQKIGDTTFPEVTKDEFDLTQRLFKRESFTLVERKNFNFDNNKTIQNLMDSWETVIAYFVDTNKSTTASKDPTVLALVKATAEARFFTMHGLLEVLYDQLESNRRTADILSSAI